MVRCEVERDAKVDGVLEGFVNSVKIFGLYPKGDGEFFKEFKWSDVQRSCED